MSSDVPREPSEADRELEREIRRGRKFSLSEAIGRMAGPGAMKGASPVSRKQQSESEIDLYLGRHLGDRDGALRVVLGTRVKESALLLQDYDQPLLVLATFVKQVLDSDYRLVELVRDADVEWGRIFGERPLFEREGSDPNPDDPYTLESVRRSLIDLLRNLTSEASPKSAPQN